jgi:hypothetical protein
MDFKCDELILGKKDADSRALTIRCWPCLSWQIGHPDTEPFLLGKPASDQPILELARFHHHIQYLCPTVPPSSILE